MILQVGPVLLAGLRSTPTPLGIGTTVGQFVDIAARAVSRGKIRNLTLGGFLADRIFNLGVRTTERLSKASRLQQRAALKRANITGDTVLRAPDPFRTGFSLVSSSQVEAGLVPRLQLEAAVRQAEPQILRTFGLQPLTPAQRARMLSAGEFPNTPEQVAAAARIRGVQT